MVNRGNSHDFKGYSFDMRRRIHMCEHPKSERSHHRVKGQGEGKRSTCVCHRCIHPANRAIPTPASRSGAVC